MVIVDKLDSQMIVRKFNSHWEPNTSGFELNLANLTKQQQQLSL